MYVHIETCGNHEMTEWLSMAELSQQNNSFLLFLYFCGIIRHKYKHMSCTLSYI